MAVPVYGWPPVGVVSWDWTVDAPISISRSALTGARYASAHQRERRVAQIVVSALGRGSLTNQRLSAGYVEMLKRLLNGGSNLVRLYSRPVTWYRDAVADMETRRSLRFLWEDGAADLDWTFSGVDGLWYDGQMLDGTLTTSSGFPAVVVTGLLPNRLVARPGDFVTSFEDHDDTTGSTAQVLAPAYSDGDGEATIRLFSALATAGRINIGIADTAVFEVEGELPRSPQPVSGDWTYGWSFREVFSDEVGGFTEVPSWFAET